MYCILQSLLFFSATSFERNSSVLCVVTFYFSVCFMSLSCSWNDVVTYLKMLRNQREFKHIWNKELLQKLLETGVFSLFSIKQFNFATSSQTLKLLVCECTLKFGKDDEEKGFALLWCVYIYLCFYSSASVNV